MGVKDEADAVFISWPASTLKQMTNIRGAAGSTVSSPGLIVGSLAVVVVVLLIFLQQQLRRRKRRIQYHPPLQLETTSEGVLEQIGKRKEDIIRYIDSLKEQLAAREDQLRYHNELEELVTSRVETSRRDDEEWEKLMKAGKKVHGKKWNASNGDEPSLRELMELHKDELLEYRRSLHSSDSNPQRDTHRERRAIRRPIKFNLPLLKLQPVAPLPSASHGTGATVNPGGVKFIPTQWQSTRLTARARTASLSARLTPYRSDVAKEDLAASPSPPKTTIPPLDFSRLGSGPAVVERQEQPDEVEQKPKRKALKRPSSGRRDLQPCSERKSRSLW